MGGSAVTDHLKKLTGLSASRDVTETRASRGVRWDASFEPIKDDVQAHTRGILLRWAWVDSLNPGAEASQCTASLIPPTIRPIYGSHRDAGRLAVPRAERARRVKRKKSKVERNNEGDEEEESNGD